MHLLYDYNVIYKVIENLTPAGTFSFIHSAPILQAHHCQSPLFWFPPKIPWLTSSLPSKLYLSLFQIFTFPTSPPHSQSSSPFLDLSSIAFTTLSHTIEHTSLGVVYCLPPPTPHQNVSYTRAGCFSSLRYLKHLKECLAQNKWLMIFVEHIGRIKQITEFMNFFFSLTISYAQHIFFNYVHFLHLWITTKTMFTDVTD